MSPEETQSNIIDYPAGTTLVREGDEQGTLFVLFEGRCTVLKHDVEITSFDEMGTCFGEMSMILNVPRTATVKAATDVKVYEFEIDLDTMLAKYPEMTKVILQTLAKRVAVQTNNMFTHFAKLDLKELGLDLQKKSNTLILKRPLKQADNLLPILT